jgi:hypothetical protein
VDFYAAEHAQPDKLTVYITAVFAEHERSSNSLLHRLALDPSQQQSARRGSGKTSLKGVFGR